MNYVTGVTAVVLLVATAVFAFQNTGQTDVSFLLWSFSAPKILLILGTFLLGMISGWGVVELIKKGFS